MNSVLNNVDIFSYILSYIADENLLSIRLVCKYFNYLCNEKVFLHKLDKICPNLASKRIVDKHDKVIDFYYFIRELKYGRLISLVETNFFFNEYLWFQVIIYRKVPEIVRLCYDNILNGKYESADKYLLNIGYLPTNVYSIFMLKEFSNIDEDYINILYKRIYSLVIIDDFCVYDKFILDIIKVTDGCPLVIDEKTREKLDENVDTQESISNIINLYRNHFPDELFKLMISEISNTDTDFTRELMNSLFEIAIGGTSYQSYFSKNDCLHIKECIQKYSLVEVNDPFGNKRKYYTGYYYMDYNQIEGNHKNIKNTIKKGLSAYINNLSFHYLGKLTNNLLKTILYNITSIYDRRISLLFTNEFIQSTNRLFWKIKEEFQIDNINIQIFDVYSKVLNKYKMMNIKLLLVLLKLIGYNSLKSVIEDVLEYNSNVENFYQFISINNDNEFFSILNEIVIEKITEITKGYMNGLYREEMKDFLNEIDKLNQPKKLKN